MASQLRHEKRCHDGAVCWYDNCGQRGELEEECGSDQRCSRGRCRDEERRLCCCDMAGNHRCEILDGSPEGWSCLCFGQGVGFVCR